MRTRLAKISGNVRDDDEGELPQPPVGADRLLTAMRERLEDQSLVPESTLTEFLTVNGIPNAGKIPRDEKVDMVSRALNLINYTSYLPQKITLTSTLLRDVLDPLMTVNVPTGIYRLTMHKLLRLSLNQLQQQAELMNLNIVGLDEIGLARTIIVNATPETELIPEIAKMLLAKEIAFVFGVKLEIALKSGYRHPSSTVSIVLRPSDMERSSILTRADLLAECENQSVPIDRSKDNKAKLALRLVMWITEHHDQFRTPVTPAFAEFIHQELLKGQRL